MKSWVKKFFVKSGFFRAAARLKPPAAVILAYHSVRDDPRQDSNWIGPGITHATKVFQRHMELVAHRFHPVGLEDIALFVRGEKALPSRAVAVTFDDGYVDNFEVAGPVLTRFGISAAIYLTVSMIGQPDAPWFSRVRNAFISTSCAQWDSSLHRQKWDLSFPPSRERALLAAYDVCAPHVGQAQEEVVALIEQELQVPPRLPERRLMLTWDEARKLRRAGHIVGSHTLTHPNVAHVAKRQAMYEELIESKSRLERELAESVLHFSYPHPALNPQWNRHSLQLTLDAGYQTALTTTKGPVFAGMNPLLLSRMNAPRPEYEFLWNLERAFLKPHLDPLNASPAPVESEMYS